MDLKEYLNVRRFRFQLGVPVEQLKRVRLVRSHGLHVQLARVIRQSIREATAAAMQIVSLNPPIVRRFRNGLVQLEMSPRDQKRMNQSARR
jgi:hypothetical protein